MSAPEQIDDGGPAFPHPELVQDMISEDGGVKGSRVYHAMPGMSLRDWFASQATENDIEMHTGGDIDPRSGRVVNGRTREQAKYHYADAMIAARKGGQS